MLSDSRFFLNAPVCDNVFSSNDFPDIANEYEGKPIPVAYGNIRFGICIPIDTKDFDPAVGGTITYIVADDSKGNVNISNVYSSRRQPIQFSILNPNRFTITLSANQDFNIDDVRWSGLGYFGITNGLNIITKCFAEQGNYAFNDYNYNTIEWGLSAINNDSSIGLSIQSTGTIIDEVVEPITKSLFGINTF